MRLPARLAKLEAASRSSRFVIMFRRHDETDEQVTARWRAEHPGEDPDAAGVGVIIVTWVGGAPCVEPT
jgi:hypothetical protein